MRADDRPVTVKTHTRRRPTRQPKETRAERNSRAQLAAITTSQKSVAQEAYKSNSLATRKAAVRRAKQGHTSDFERSAVLRVHGARVSPRGRERAAAARVRGRYDDTPAVLPINRQPKPSNGFTGFSQEQKRRLALKPGQAAKDPAIQKQAKRELAAGAAGTAHLDPFERVFKSGVKTPGVYTGGALKSGVSFALEQLGRTGAATAAAGLEDAKVIRKQGLGHYLAKGGGPAARKAAVTGFKHPNEHITDWNKALEQLGVHNGVAKVAGGLALSVATDPLTFAATGASAPAKIRALKVLEDARAAGKSEHEALAAARSVYDKAPAHEKIVQPRIGLRGAAAKAGHRAAGTPKSRILMSQPFGGRVVTAPKAALGKVGIKVKPLGGAGEKLRDATARRFNAVRPSDWHPIDFEYARRTGRGLGGRAGLREAQRASQARFQAYKQMEGWSPEEQQQFTHAVETVGPGGDFSHLPPKIQKVAEAWDKERQVIQHQRVKMGIAHPLEHEGRVGFHGAAPPEPKFAAPIPREMVASSAARVRNVKKQLETALKTIGEEKGRRSILGWRVPGLSKTPSLGKTAAEARVAMQREHVKNVMTEHEVLKGEYRVQRRAQKAYEREMAAREAAPAGFYPRVPKPSEEGLHSSYYGATRRTNVTNPARRDTRRLDLMEPEKLARYEPRPHVAIARYVEKHHENLRLHELNQRLAALGETRHIGAHEVQDYAGNHHFLFARDEHGFKPVFNSRTGEVDGAKLAAAVARGHHIVEVHPAKLDAVRSMAEGARVAQPSRLALGTAMGEQPNNAYDRFTRGLKTAQTTVGNPVGYFVTNALGDSVNAVLHDTSAASFVAAGRLRKVESALVHADKQLDLLPRTSRKRKILEGAHTHVDHYPRYGQLSDAEVVRGLVSGGAIRTGLTGAELRAAKRSLDPAEGITAWQRIVDRAQSTNEWREDAVRLATAHGALKRGASFEEAAAHSLRAHIDYADLSTVEKTFFRRIIPYWTWVSRNTAIQARGMATRPGLYATTYKVQSQGAEAAGYPPNWREHLSPAEQQAVPIPAFGLKKTVTINGKKIRVPIEWNPKLPVSDVGNFPFPQKDLATGRISPEKTAKQFASNTIGKFNPLVTKPTEALTGVSAFTLDQHPSPDQAAPWWLPKELTHDIRDKRTGATIRGANWRWHLIEAFPAATTAQASTAPTSKFGQPGRGFAALSSTAGARLSPNLPQLRKINENFERLDDIDKRIASLQGRVTDHVPGEEYKASKHKDIARQLKLLNAAKAKITAQTDEIARSLGIPATMPKKAGRPRKPDIGFGSGFGGGALGAPRSRGGKLP